MSPALALVALPSFTSPLTGSKEVSLMQNKLYKDFFRKIKGYYINKTRNYRLSEELAHEALHKVLKGLPSFQEGRNLDNWVHGVARNNLFDHYRSLKTNKNKINQNTTYVDSYQDNTVDTDFNGSEETFLMERLTKILATFTPLDETIFRAQVFDGQDYEELAERFDFPVETIKNKLAYMRKKVRTLLSND